MVNNTCRFTHSSSDICLYVYVKVALKSIDKIETNGTISFFPATQQMQELPCSHLRF